MTIYRVSSSLELSPADPLHVSRFYPPRTGRHHQKMRDRQDLILYLASIHSSVSSFRGFNAVPLRLMSLKEWVYDFRPALDYFFEVVHQGYRTTDRFEVSTVVPKELPAYVLPKVSYTPPPYSGGVKSKVFIQQRNRESILRQLVSTGRADLLPPVEYLLERQELHVYFQRAGNLQLRDTSVWPVPALETWPAWLREELFGPGIDIEAAYTQFLVERLKEVHSQRNLKLQYPDLLRLLGDKVRFREELCRDILQLEPTEESIGVVKKLWMSLANGARVSPAIMRSGRSSARDIVLKHLPTASTVELTRIGTRLQYIARQFESARKQVCGIEIGSPTRENQKKVFWSYFEWERVARYKIWEAVGRHGVMVHDGIDGIPEEFLVDIPGLVKSLDIRLSRS